MTDVVSSGADASPVADDPGAAAIALALNTRDSRSVPFPIERSNLIERGTLLINSILDSNPALVKTAAAAEFAAGLQDKDKAAALLSDQFDTLLKVARNEVGTHTDKLPDATRGGMTVFSEVQQLPDAPFVCSLSVSTRATLGGAGNAANARGQRFLARSILVDGEEASVADSVARGGLIADLFVELGVAADRVAELKSTLLEAMSGIPASKAVDGEVKVLLLPDGRGGYIQATPLHSFSMFVEVNSRISESYEAGNVVLRRRFSVGGDKPQNGGYLNSDFYGVHNLLMGLPPQMSLQSDVEQVVTTAMLRKTILGRPSKDSLEQITKIRNLAINNVHTAEALDDAIEWACRGILHPATTILAALDVALPLMKLAELKSQSEAKLLVHGWSGAYPQDKKAIRQSVYEIFSEYSPDQSGHLLSRDRVFEAVDIILSNY